nr:unnamed protein product [Digitaria exilis]
MWSDLGKGNNHERVACNMFEEISSSEFDECRSPNRVLEVTIHKMEIKWGRRNTTKSLSTQAAPKLPPSATPAPTASLTMTIAAPTTSYAAAATVTFGDTPVISPGSEHATM